MANTENIEAKLCAYVDGDLDAAGRAEIEAHLAANPQHRQLMSALMQQREMIRQLPRVKAPEDLLEAVHSQLERSVLLGQGTSQADVAGRINRLPQVLAVAAVLMLAIGLMAVIYFVLPQNNPKRVDYARNTVATSAPMTDSITPPVGTVARSEPDQAARALATPTPDTRRTPEKAEAPAVTVTAAPAAIPSTPAAPAATDVFSKNASSKIGEMDIGNAGKNAGAKSVGGAYNNMFANAGVVEEQLKNAPAVADNSMVMVVSSGNPSAVNQQVQNYLSSNSIRWQSVAEPMPEPLDLNQGQVLSPSRAQNWQGRLKSGDQILAQNEASTQVGAQQAPQKAKEAPNAGVATATAPSAIAQNSDKAGISQQNVFGGGGAENSIAGTQPSSARMQQRLASRNSDVPATQPSQQLIIARGVTRQQLADLNVCVQQNSDGRIQNFRRANGSYAIATLPDDAAAATPAQHAGAPTTQPGGQPLVKVATADRERSTKDSEEAKLGAASDVAKVAAKSAAPATLPTTTATLADAPATTRSAASTGAGDAMALQKQSNGQSLDEINRRGVSSTTASTTQLAAGAVSTTAPSSQPVAASAPAEALDVVIVLQTEFNDAGAAGQQDQAVQPNQSVQTSESLPAPPAATSAPTPPAPSPTVAPASSPAAPASQPATLPSAH